MIIGFSHGVKHNFTNKKTHLLYIVLALAMGAIFALVALRIASSREIVNTDFFKLWLSGKLVTRHANPYMSEIWADGHYEFGSTWVPERSFIYPLPLSYVFVPLSLFPVYQAYVIWVFITQILVFVSIMALIKVYPLPISKHLIFPSLVGVILFRPFIITLYNGQVSGLILFLLVWIIIFWEKNKLWQGSVLLPFLALKPNLGGPVIILLLFYLVIQRQWKSLIVAGFSGLMILLAGLVQNPHWLQEYLEVGETKLVDTFGFSPTIWGISAYGCGFQFDCTIVIGIVTTLLLLCSFIYIVLMKHNVFTPGIVVSLATTLMLLIIPYTWPYDQLLLVVPILILMTGLSRRGYKYLLVAMIFLLVDILAIAMLLVSINIQLEIWSVAVPFIIFLCLVWLIIPGEVTTKSQI